MNNPTSSLRRWLSLIVLTGALCPACATRPLTSPPNALSFHPGFSPDNVYTYAPKLSESVRRVAVLPMSCDEKRSELVEGREALETVLISELVKTKKFEVVRVTAEDLRHLTGRARWTGEEILPDGFFGKLQEKYGCDAVLFGQLTEFRAYAPMSIGWRLKLVDARNCYAIWAGDEQFDAGQPAVQASALRYQWWKQRIAGTDEGEWASLNSPRRFGQYTVAQLFETLPAR